MSTLNETLTERGSQYGDFGQMAADAQAAKTIFVTEQMTPVQRECVEFICTKLARLANGNPNNRDSWVDIAGYAQLAVLELDGGDLP